MGAGDSEFCADVSERCCRCLILVEPERIHAQSRLVLQVGAKRMRPVEGTSPPGVVCCLRGARIRKWQASEDALTRVEFGKTSEEIVFIRHLVIDPEISLIAVEVVSALEGIVVAEEIGRAHV